MRALVLTLTAALALTGTGCVRRARVVERDVSVPVTSGGSSTGSSGVVITETQATTTTVQAQGELLYIPAEAAAYLEQVARIVVQTSSGQVIELTRADLVQAAFGRMALRIPAGVTTGTVTVFFLNGQQYSTTFHIAVTGGSAQIVGSVGSYEDPYCHAIDGTWVGNISSDPGARATMQVEVLGDCRTIRGFIHFEQGGGSVDSTIDGTWDARQGMLIGRDTQLFNVAPGPGGGFCATDQYVFHLEQDGATFTGRNITRSYGCEGDSPVFLQHVSR
ncbi:MAG: hypothetical protein U0234_12765 [Sandaracinus sp.]